jgi:hypothetical protein
MSIGVDIALLFNGLRKAGDEDCNDKLIAD